MGVGIPNAPSCRRGPASTTYFSATRTKTQIAAINSTPFNQTESRCPRLNPTVFPASRNAFKCGIHQNQSQTVSAATASNATAETGAPRNSKPTAAITELIVINA